MSLIACSTGPTSSRSLAAAISRLDCAWADNAPTRRLKIAVSLGPRAIGPSGASLPLRWASVRARGISINASGFPPAAAQIRSATRGGNCEVTANSALAAAASIWARRSVARPSNDTAGRSPSRTAKTIRIPSAWTRRAAKTIAAREGWSNHWASSTSATSGDRSAALDRRPRVAVPMANGSPGTGGPSASALARAAACGWGSAPSSPSSGRRRSARPEKASSDSDSVPLARSTVKPVAWLSR